MNGRSGWAQGIFNLSSQVKGTVNFWELLFQPVNIRQRFFFPSLLSTGFFDIWWRTQPWIRRAHVVVQGRACQCSVVSPYVWRSCLRWVQLHRASEPWLMRIDRLCLGSPLLKRALLLSGKSWCHAIFSVPLEPERKTETWIKLVHGRG